ncbi:substrate-binding domain-containing protein [Paenibacillus aestuarii]|uniref:Substrate-binding domain-containing protein n=1 Tax=Paenibacillus aestuarii TaxID=516965 RepID=A0ABW0K2N7_9BACL|nr:substrate-binding domain-containing protein [Paenibacillus aestuarii]
MKKLIVIYMILIAAFIGYVTLHQLNSKNSKDYGLESGLRGEVDEKYVMVTFQAGMDYWKRGIKGFEDAAKVLNVSVEYRGATQYDANEENTVLEQVIAKKPAGIAVTAINPEALTATIDKAVQAGIPVVLFDSNTMDSKVRTFLGTDNRSAGATAANQLAKLIEGTGKVAIITRPGQLNHQERTDGFVDTLKSSYPNIQVVAIENGKGDQAESEQATRRIIQQVPDLNGIFATEANGGIGVGNALLQTGKAGKIKVIGFDTDKGTLDMVKNGVLSETLAQGTWNMGYWSLQYLFHLHHGLGDSNGESISTLPVYTDTGISVVTKTNVDSYYAK